MSISMLPLLSAVVAMPLYQTMWTLPFGPMAILGNQDEP
jgi:hypothetical protein